VGRIYRYKLVPIIDTNNKSRRCFMDSDPGDGNFEFGIALDFHVFLWIINGIQQEKED
jgi:hypothetical protein